MPHGTTVRVKANEASQLFDAHANRLLEVHDFIKRSAPDLEEIIRNYAMTVECMERIAARYRELGDRTVEIRTGALPGDLQREAFRLGQPE
jgi:hypothetical protein